ncbi:MAG: TlpA disulfide reductase family protein [Patescibacteria group bacterium]
MVITHTERGISPVGIIALLAGLVIAGSALYVRYGMYDETARDEPVIPTPSSMRPETSALAQAPTDSDSSRIAMQKSALSVQPVAFTGKKLAGSSAPLLDFSVADYTAAQESGRIIVLFFYANWCPICKAEMPNIEQAFNQLKTDRVVGFRVNYNDSDTDDVEKGLAREFGIAYQHTKVFVNNGSAVLKSGESWDVARYVQEITKASQ